MTKLTIDSNPKKIVLRIHDLQLKLSELPRGSENFGNPGLYNKRNEIKKELNELYRFRNKQKKMK